MGVPILARLDAHDRALYLRVATGPSRRRVARWAWTVVTHLGGVSGSVAAALVPMLLGGTLRAAATDALLALVASHLVVQLLKRTVGRPRPSRRVTTAQWMAEPDKFSFPSGHSAASMSVATAYALDFPSLALLLVPLAGIVGFSRVRLGVHYPGDVVVGQAIAVATVLVLS